MTEKTEEIEDRNSVAIICFNHDIDGLESRNKRGEN